MTVGYIAAKALMKCFPSAPDLENFANREIFLHDRYLLGSEEQKKEIRRQSALSGYLYEQNPADSWLEKYFFPAISAEDLRNTSLLDLGCFTGGRVVAWAQKYSIEMAYGIEIDPIFALAATEFANEKGVNASFSTGYAESLPYEDESFDFVVSTDVFEHVRDLPAVLNECHRTLKRNGKLLCVFPQFFQPLEAHLNFATSLPAMQWLFSGKDLARANYEVICERGGDSARYAPKSPSLMEWERLPTLNGITVAKFRRMIGKGDWTVEWKKRPILTDGRRSKQLKFRILSRIFSVPARLPVLEELFLGRICCVLRKTGRPK